MTFNLYSYDEARMNRTKIQHYKRFPLMFQGLFVSEGLRRIIKVSPFEKPVSNIVRLSIQKETIGYKQLNAK